MDGADAFTRVYVQVLGFKVGGYRVTALVLIVSLLVYGIFNATQAVRLEPPKEQEQVCRVISCHVMSCHVVWTFEHFMCNPFLCLYSNPNPYLFVCGSYSYHSGFHRITCSRR